MREITKEEDVLDLIRRAKSEDIPYERVFSSMCTYPHPIAVKAHNLFLSSNAGDPGIFKGTNYLENKVIYIIGELLHKKDACGYISTGGTESNLQAIRMARNIKRGKKPNFIVSAMGHFSFDKTADILGVKLKKAKVRKDLTVDPDSVRELIDNDTIAIVGIAGTTEFGQIDPIEELSEIALEKNVFLHIDGAFGGFVIPFLDKKYPFDFELEGVSSISIDPHKMGLSVIPSGALLIRDKKYLKCLEVYTPYLSSKSQFTLTGTRSGASIAATYAVLTYLGWNGFKSMVDRCLHMTDLIIEGMKDLDIYPVIDPKMNVLALNVPKICNIFDNLWKKGWCVSKTRKPKALRLVVMPHITEDIVYAFLKDFKDVLRATL